MASGPIVYQVLNENKDFVDEFETREEAEEHITTLKSKCTIVEVRHWVENDPEAEEPAEEEE